MPIQRRSILCVDKRELVLHDSKCSQEAKPSDTQPCQNLATCRGGGGKQQSKKEQMTGDVIDLNDEMDLDDEMLDGMNDELSDDENSEENQV